MRVPNWDVALAEWASEQIGRPFIWGETDCCTLVRKGLALVLGDQVIPNFGYHSEVEARQVVPCGGRLAEQLALFGHAVPLDLVQSADVLVLPADPGEFCDGLGLIVGTNRVLMADPDDGVRSVRFAALRKVLPIEAFRLTDG